jgi:hypothetical protein
MTETDSVTLAIPTITATEINRGAADLQGAMTVLVRPAGIPEDQEGQVREAARYVRSDILSS